MASFKRKKSNKKPSISTASLPDIIFMLLFFFMVVTVMRERRLLVNITLPQASEVVKLKNPSLVKHLYIGNPTNSQLGDKPVIQINDAFAKIEDIEPYLHANSKEFETISLRVDKEVTMGLVAEVKTEIRKANRLKLNYAALYHKK